MIVRWFCVSVLCCLALPWFNAVRLAVDVACVKTEQHLAVNNASQSGTDTLIVNESLLSGIAATQELRQNGVAYDVVSWKKIGSQLRVVVLKDENEAKLERVATNDNDRRERLQTTGVAFPVYFEERSLSVPGDAWFVFDAGTFAPSRCYDGSSLLLIAQPPENVA